MKNPQWYHASIKLARSSSSVPPPEAATLGTLGPANPGGHAPGIGIPGTSGSCTPPTSAAAAPALGNCAYGWRGNCAYGGGGVDEDGAAYELPEPQ